MLNGGTSGNNDNKIGSTQSDGIVHTSVPTDLKTLIRMVLRTFYGFELFLCIEMLIIYPCIKEEDLAELLRLDLKLVHQYLLNLKKEKFINESSIMETNTIDGKQSKHSYFYINYKMMVNVIKYKLDKIRIQIESEENQFTTRANFKCTMCKKTYSDLDTKDIFLTMQCLYCGAEVEEDTSSLPTKTARNLLNKFNTQMKAIFDLLSKVEHIRLADFLLRPKPVDMTSVLERITNTSGSTQSKNNSAITNGKTNLLKFDNWSGEKTRNVDKFGSTQISINFDSSESSNLNNRKLKELPSILLLNRTQEDDLDNVNNRDSILLNNVMKAANETSIGITNKLNNKDQNVLDSSQLTSNVNISTSSINNKFSTSSLVTSVGNSSINNNLVNGQTTANLETIIMQKLLKHEKKIEINSINSDEINQKNTNFEEIKSISSITITKKRNLDETVGHQANKLNINPIEQNENFTPKKRRLNNGDFSTFESQVLTKNSNMISNSHNFRRNNSDGSDREDADIDSEGLSYSDGFDSTNSESAYLSSNVNPNEDDLNDSNIPRVTVKSKLFRLDRITPKLINSMNDNEKENYINICRQLYSEIYDI